MVGSSVLVGTDVFVSDGLLVGDDMLDVLEFSLLVSCFSETWSELLADPERIQRMSEEGIKNVNAKFTNPVLSKEVLTVYEKVVSAMKP